MDVVYAMTKRSIHLSCSSSLQKLSHMYRSLKSGSLCCNMTAGTCVTLDHAACNMCAYMYVCMYMPAGRLVAHVCGSGLQYVCTCACMHTFSACELM